MKIHEYQAKEIFRRFGVPTPRGEMVTSPEQAREVATKLGTPVVVVKAQIHAGGRGKAGGVKLARSADEAAQLASKILGMTLVTPQTGPGGRVVKRLLVEEGPRHQARALPQHPGGPRRRSAGHHGQRRGRHGDRRSRARKSRRDSARAHSARRRFAALSGAQAGLRARPRRRHGAVAIPFLQSLYRAFLDTDASLAEINPLIVTGDGRLIALDAKMTFDDNALDRHKELAALRDLDEEDPLEVEASRYKLNYIKLDGTVGCMVNGAGLAMATMDIIKLAGGSPANFLDVGGGANAEQVKNAFKILTSDPEVKGVFINIFGGILRCDVLAGGVVAAARDLNLKLPVVVRMEGTNVEKGREILKESGLAFTVAEGMKDGAEKIVRLAGGAR